MLSDFEVWSESVKVNGIWDGEGLLWGDLGSQDEVVFASIADTDGSVEISEGPLNQFVNMYSCEFMVSKQRVLSEYCFKSEVLCIHEYNVLKDAYALMSVYDVYLFSY